MKLLLESKNNYEYLLVEDLKPAGLEAVALQSGLPLYAKEMRMDTGDSASDDKKRYTGKTLWVYQELRDRKVACFIAQLPEGLWEIEYEMRTEAPGSFQALPATVEGMYNTALTANSQEQTLNIVEE